MDQGTKLNQQLLLWTADRYRQKRQEERKVRRREAPSIQLKTRQDKLTCSLSHEFKCCAGLCILPDKQHPQQAQYSYCCPHGLDF